MAHEEAAPASQGGRPRGKPSLPTPSPWARSLQECEKTNLVGVFSWQAQQDTGDVTRPWTGHLTPAVRLRSRGWHHLTDHHVTETVRRAHSADPVPRPGPVCTLPGCISSRFPPSLALVPASFVGRLVGLRGCGHAISKWPHQGAAPQAPGP